MGQNKVNDERITGSLAKHVYADDPQVRENVAWGIGEAAGTVTMNKDAMNVIALLLDDGERDVRGMAAWAAGRIRHKCGLNEYEEKLKTLLNDNSEYVRAAAKFALDG
jgi:HEAT repeat protein